MRYLTIAAAVLLLLSGVANAFGDKLTYDTTVQLIKNTMVSRTSAARRESYQAIAFDGCRLDYTVSGTYPTGGPYTIRFSGLDFSSLDPREVKTGKDYTAFVVLTFRDEFRYHSDVADLKVHSTVINVSDDEGAGILSAAFLQLGEMCKEADRRQAAGTAAKDVWHQP